MLNLAGSYMGIFWLVALVRILSFERDGKGNCSRILSICRPVISSGFRSKYFSGGTQQWFLSGRQSETNVFHNLRLVRVDPAAYRSSSSLYDWSYRPYPILARKDDQDLHDRHCERVKQFELSSCLPSSWVSNDHESLTE